MISHIIENMSYFPPHMLVQNCQELLPRFNEVTFAQLGDLDTPKPRRYFIRGILLHSSKGNQKIRTWQPNKKTGGGTMKEIPSCDRFVIFGVPGQLDVILLFSTTAAESKTTLRFSNLIRPGCEVAIVNPQVRSFLGDNIVVSISHPIVPVVIPSDPRAVLPPANLEKPHYAYFNFITHSLRLISCVPLDSVCSGTFCDSQTGTSSCACLLSDSKKHWCLRLTVTCDEFQEMAKEDVDFVSTQTTTDFVAHETMIVTLSHPGLNTLDIEDRVSINA